MKRLRILLAALLLATGAAAQNPAAYFMEGSTFRTQFNPAFAPRQGYFNVPAAGGIDINMNSSLGLDDILYPRDGKLVTLFDRSVTADEALRNIKENNLLGLDVRTNILGFGKYTRNRKNFWAFDINLHAAAELSVPKSLFEFVKRGEEGVIRDFGATASTYLDAGFSYSFPLLGDKLYVGAKAKVLVGLARAKLTFDRMDVTLRGDRWAADTYATLDANIPEAEINYRYDEESRPYFELSDIHMKGFKPTGYGFAVDLGATYDVLPDLQVSLAVTDLGFINWNKENNIRGHSEEHAEYTGIVVENGEAAASPDFSFDDLLRFRPDDSQTKARILQASLNAGAEYFVWDHRVGFGLLYRARLDEYKTQHSVTGSVNFSPARWFTLTAAYTLVGGRGNSLGLAMNLCPGWINFYVATDLATARFSPQFIPVKQRSANMTFGLGFPLGKRGLRIPGSNRS